MIALFILAIVFGGVLMLACGVIAAAESGPERSSALIVLGVVSFLVLVCSLGLGAAV